jgi:hypothetical protein
VLQGTLVNQDRCAAAYDAMQGRDIPADTDGAAISQQWRSEVTTVFVDSCVSGTPSVPVPAELTSAPAPHTAPVAPPIRLHHSPTG